jgi:dTDP-4-amino-4,6-dideoxygalactose transaminase
VEEFEHDFARFCDARHCVGVGSGTDALRFALLAAGIKPGETVLTVPNTFIATTEAITQAGAQPEFIDIDKRTHNIDIDELREYLENKCSVDKKTGNPVSRVTNKQVTAIVPVHLYGQMADMDLIIDIAEQYNLTVIEDACQAHGAEYFSKKESCWKKAGSMGIAAAFSFYPGKNLGACGEGGAVTTNDEEVAKKIKMFRDHGQSKKYFHEMEGYNGRLDAIQAGILQIKLRNLPDWNGQRRQNASIYRDLLSNINNIVIPYEPEWTKSVYHLYVIRSSERNELQAYLKEKGIMTGLHYPVPLHYQNAYQGLGYSNGGFPVSEKYAQEILSLPMYPGLTKDQQYQVAKKIKEFSINN